MIVLELTGEKVNVYPFSENLPAVQEVPIATVLTIWECIKTGDIWMLLVINEALYFGNRLKESLLCPNQLRADGILVQYAPIQFDLTSTHSSTHSSKEEEEHYPQHSDILTEHYIAVVSQLMQSQVLIELSELSVDKDLALRLVAAVNIESDARNGDGLDERPQDPLCALSEEDQAIFALSTKERRPVITKEILAQRWGTGLDTAHRTLTVTTQCGIRHILHPVEHHYKTQQSHLCFPTLNTRFYTDMADVFHHKISAW
jgi:hypothetical protein